AGSSPNVGQAFQPDVRLESLTYAPAADFSPNLEAIQNPQAPFLDPLGLDVIAPPHPTRLFAADPMGFASTIHDGGADSSSSSAAGRPTGSAENSSFTPPDVSSSSSGAAGVSP